jgi:mannose-6-phosphate isomerase-like protein (cupin superfamily)
VRRVIINVDTNGCSFVQSDEQIRDTGVIWTANPKDFQNIIDAIDPDSVLKMVQPPPGGAIWVLVEYPPGAGMQPRSRPDRPGMDERGFHVTRTVDFVYVLDGGLVLDVDRETVELRTGDVVILQAANHAWRNPTGRKVRFIDVVVSGVRA